MLAKPGENVGFAMACRLRAAATLATGRSPCDAPPEGLVAKPRPEVAGLYAPQNIPNSAADSTPKTPTAEAAALAAACAPFGHNMPVRKWSLARIGVIHL